MQVLNIYSVSFIMWILLCETIKHIKYQNTVLGNTAKYRKFVIIGFVIIFGSLIAFRNETVGADTRAYNQIFRGLASISNPLKTPQFRKFPAYVILCRLLSYISEEPQILVIVTGFGIVLCNAVFIFYESKDITLSIYLYIALNFYMYAFNITRQHLAMSLLLIAYLMLKRKHMGAAIVIILVATGIHNTAIVGFLLLPLFILRPSYKVLGIYTGMSAAYATMGVPLAMLFIRLFRSYINVTSAGFSFSEADSSGNRIYTAFFLVILEIAGIYLLAKNKWKEDDRGQFIRLICFSNIGVFSMIFLKNYYIFSRVEGFFTQYLMILIPLIFSHPAYKRWKIFIKMLIYLVLFIPYVTKLSYYLPYSTFWQ